MTIQHKKILVLGGYGFVGRYVVKHLKNMGEFPLIGTRGITNTLQPGDKKVSFHQITLKRHWAEILTGIGAVVKLRRNPARTRT